MKIKRLPLDDVVTIAAIIRVESEEGEDDESPFADEGEPKTGTYMMDSYGRLWLQLETLTGIFQEFMDAEIKRKRGK